MKKAKERFLLGWPSFFVYIFDWGICWWFEDHLAYLIVNSLAFASAAFLLVFHSSAAWLLRGSSGFGSARRLWIDSRTDFIWSAGDQFFLRMSRQMRPRLSACVRSYRCLDGRSWYQRPPLVETWGNHQATEVMPWIFLPRSTFPEDLSMLRCTLQFNEEVLIISGIRSKCDAWHWVCLNGLGLFHYTWTGSLHFVDTKRLFNYLNILNIPTHHSCIKKSGKNKWKMK